MIEKFTIVSRNGGDSKKKKLRDVWSILKDEKLFIRDIIYLKIFGDKTVKIILNWCKPYTI